ncbi:MAG: hypothetical protein ACD_79C00998G0001 [uncultured bacterium]|nr:MAG: hypothetical protein ACD_79C00998G0001 [uncultured bacterium]
MKNIIVFSIVILMLVSAVYTRYFKKNISYSNITGQVKNKNIGVKVTIPVGWHIKDEKKFKESKKILFSDFYYIESVDKRRAKITLKVIMFEDKSKFSQEIERSKHSIEAMVSDLTFDHMTDVIPKHRATYKPFDVSGIPCMRGVYEGGLYDKTGKMAFMWQGEQVVGFSKNKFIHIITYPVDNNDQAGREIGLKGFEELLASLKIE